MDALGISVLSRLTAREETCIYQFVTNNYASFHLW